MRFYTDSHVQIQETTRRIINAEVNPYVDEWEREGMFPAHQVFKALGDAGLLGINKPEKYGGMGLDYTYSAAAIEALAHADCGAIPMAIGVQTDMSTPALAKHGSEELCNEFLVPALAGDMVACIGVSEPAAGSDVAGLTTRAVSDGDDYVINGQKMWITNSLQADFMVLLSNTGSSENVHQNKSLIVVPMDTPGVEKAKKIEKIGNHASDTGLIYFDNVRVPKRNRIGEEGLGFVYQMEQFQEERLWAVIQALPGMEAAIDETIEYTGQRHLFGQSLLDNQVVHFRLAELKTEVTLLRLAVEQAIEDYVAGKDTLQLISMLKLKLGRTGREVMDSCLQYWGGMGYSRDSRISRRFVDTRLAGIGGGADEVMLQVICKTMGILPGRRNTTGRGA